MRKMKTLILGLPIFLLISGCANRASAPCQEPVQQSYCPHDVVEETYIHKYGVTVVEDDWNKRGKHGQVITTMKNGVTVTKLYEGGILDGDTTYTFPHIGAIEKIETYAKGKLARGVEHYRNGFPKERIEYLPSQCRTVTTWYENGAAKSVEEFTGSHLAEGEFYTASNQIESRIEDGSGHRVNRDEYGQLVSLDTFKKGQIVQTEIYHPNGTPKEIANFRNGVHHGELKTFTPAGEPVSIETWHLGEQHGLTTQFENGEKIAEVPYVYGLRDGIERRFRNGREVVEQIEWKHDLKHGPAEAYVGGSNLTEWFYQGKKVNKPTFDQMSQWQANS